MTSLSKAPSSNSVHSKVKPKPSTGPSREALIKAGTEYARKTVDATFAKSNTVDHTHDFPKFDKSELGMGKLLGKGGFGTVKEVRAFTIPDHVPTKKTKSGHPDPESDEMESRKFIAQHCIRNGGDARYAVKFLSKEVAEDPALVIQGMIDMAIETRFLSSIEHPNIIKMRAVSTVDAFHSDYFLVMDRLYHTLEERLKVWATRNSRCTGLSAKVVDRSGTKAKALLEERLVAAFDLTDALSHLHGRGILYRDVKPENIGFDVRGDIKIFDFGLAKELHVDFKNADGTYKLTSWTGSIRYMAPEVALEKPYNATCDVYSMAILFWEMLALETPYALYTPKSIKEKVFAGDKRPKMDETWSRSIQLLLINSWTPVISARYDMNQMNAALKKEIVRVRGGNDRGLEHLRRRSTFVFRGKD